MSPNDLSAGAATPTEGVSGESGHVGWVALAGFLAVLSVGVVLAPLWWWAIVGMDKNVGIAWLFTSIIVSPLAATGAAFTFALGVNDD